MTDQTAPKGLKEYREIVCSEPDKDGKVTWTVRWYLDDGGKYRIHEQTGIAGSKAEAIEAGQLIEKPAQ